MPALDIRVRLDLGEVTHEVVRCRLREGASQRTEARVVIAVGEDGELEDELLERAVLRVDAGGLEARRWTLIVAEQRFVGVEAGLLRYAIELRDPLWSLSLAKNVRKFRKRSTEQIVETILAEAGIRLAWRHGRATAARNWCVQYRESSLAFVERLLADEGIHYVLDEDGTVIFGDDSTAAPPVSGRAALDLVEAADAMARGEPGIHMLRRGARLAPGSFTVNDHNWKTPAVPLVQHAVAERDTELEIYDYPAGYRDPAEGARLAQMRLEACRSRARFVEGRSSVLAFAPMRAFSVSTALPLFDGEHVLTTVEHRMNNPAFSGVDDAIYENAFEAIPMEVRFRPPIAAPPRVAGHHTAIVRGPAGEEIHTDTHGRFKAQFHWDREANGSDEDSRWVRMLQESASSMTLARVGWEVSVAYIDGDPGRPVGVARQINGEMIPSYAQPDNKTRMTIKTPSSPATGGFSELTLEDRAGAQRFDMRAERDLLAIVKHDKSEEVGRDELHVVGKNLARRIDRHQRVTVAGDLTTTVDGNDFLRVARHRRKTVDGGEKVEIGVAESLLTKKNESEKVGSMRITVAGGVGPPSAAALAARAVPSPKSVGAKVAMGAIQGAARGGGAGAAAGAKAGAKGLVPSPSLANVAAAALSGTITRTSAKGIVRMVGGGFVSVAAGNISTSVQGAYAETVGGAKITVAGGDIEEKVGVALACTVGGAILRTAADDISFSAQLAKFQVGGLALLDAGTSMRVTAKTVSVATAAGLELSTGPASAKLGPGELVLTGNLKLSAGGSIKVTSGKEDLTSA